MSQQTPRQPWYRYWEHDLPDDDLADEPTAQLEPTGRAKQPRSFHVEQHPVPEGPATFHVEQDLAEGAPPFHVEPHEPRDAVPTGGGASPASQAHEAQPGLEALSRASPPSDVREAPVTEAAPPVVPSNGDGTGAAAAAHLADGGPVHFDRARVLTIANQKGGVGKTTTAVSLSAALADLGSRVLLVDLDPQGNATSGVGVRVPQNRPTVYDVLLSGIEVEDAIEPTSVRNLFVLPSTLDLAGAEIELVSAFSREQKLRLALEDVREEYDLVLIDCPPSLGLLTVNALSAGDGLLVPIQCEYYALEGLSALRRNVELIRSQLNPNLDITGFVLTMLDARTRLSQQVVDEVRAHFGELVFTTRIPRSVRLAEAPGFGQPITVFDPSSRGAMAYRRLAVELLARLTRNDDGPPPDGRQAEGAPV